MIAGFESDSPTLGLGGMAIGFIGVASWTGKPPWPAPVLALWALPVPVFILSAVSPGLETAWMDVIVRVAGGLGADLERTGRVAFGPDGSRLEFFSVHDGLVLAHGMALVGLWDGIRHQAAPRALIARTAVYGIAGFALHGGVLLAAALWTVAGRPEAALSALRHGSALLITLAIAGIVARDALGRRAGQGTSSPQGAAANTAHR